MISDKDWSEGAELTLKTYGVEHKTTWDNSDLEAEEILDAFLGEMVGATFQERTVLRAMRDYAVERLEAYGDKD